MKPSRAAKYSKLFVITLKPVHLTAIIVFLHRTVGEDLLSQTFTAINHSL